MLATTALAAAQEQTTAPSAGEPTEAAPPAQNQPPDTGVTPTPDTGVAPPPEPALPPTDATTRPAAPAEHTIAPVARRARPAGSAAQGADSEAVATAAPPVKTNWWFLYGGLEWDVGYARYEAEDPATTDDRFFDQRGRLVIGPRFHVGMGGGYFFEATGELVAWIKERAGNYQINADDVWGKFGKQDLWDIQVGRFEAWPVYHKFPFRDRDPRPQIDATESTGAFDLYTLEDTGALCATPLAADAYCIDIYEVNYILLREEVGSIAVHLYPHRTLRFELHAKYGEANQSNHIGGRAAVVFEPAKFLKLSAGGEYRTLRQSSPARLDPEGDGTFVDRENGGRIDRRGFGGGAVVRLGPVEFAANAALGLVDLWRPDSIRDPDASPKVTSFGGYAQVDVGPVTVGGAGNYTLRTDPSDNRQTHLQTAAYVYYPFYEMLSLKLVGFYAQGTNDPFNSRDIQEPPTNEFFGARLRLKYLFNTF